jgi:hypothetical protein
MWERVEKRYEMVLSKIDQARNSILKLVLYKIDK